MKTNRCLICYQPLLKAQYDFHSKCSIKVFGTPDAPLLEYSDTQIKELALEVIRSHIAVTGVQPKLSLQLPGAKSSGKPRRFTIVGLWGSYILKPPSQHYKQLPEIEDLTMHLASIARIRTVPHSLIRMKSGPLAYITKRIDRVRNIKVHMEDMCQLTERLTEDKYQGSYEHIAKTIRMFSVNPGLDVINYFEQVLFAFLTGNADMHLKNFSLINRHGLGYGLSPAYDMVATALVNPEDTEELALTLNGKKRGIKRKDFVAAFDTLEIDSKQQFNMFKKFAGVVPDWLKFIRLSFLNEELKDEYENLIRLKIETLGLQNFNQ